MGHMTTEEWGAIVEKAVKQYSREKQEIDLLIFPEVRHNK